MDTDIDQFLLQSNVPSVFHVYRWFRENIYGSARIVLPFFLPETYDSFSSPREREKCTFFFRRGLAEKSRRVDRIRYDGSKMPRYVSETSDYSIDRSKVTSISCKWNGWKVLGVWWSIYRDRIVRFRTSREELVSTDYLDRRSIVSRHRPIVERIPPLRYHLVQLRVTRVLRHFEFPRADNNGETERKRIIPRQEINSTGSRYQTMRSRKNIPARVGYFELGKRQQRPPLSTVAPLKISLR